MSEYFDGRWEQKTALRKALVALNARGASDQRITDLLAQYVGNDRVPKYGSASSRAVTRPTIQRIRSSDDKTLRGVRSATVGVLYNFLCHCEELETDLFDRSARIHSAHMLAPLTSAIEAHIGATDGPLTHFKLKSFQGVYHLYRKAWTSLGAESFIRCVIRFDWVGDALFYTEEQFFTDTVANTQIDEVESGVVIPFGLNVVMLGKRAGADLMKFYSIDNFSIFPDGKQIIHNFSGNFIAVYGKGEHPGYRAYAERVRPESASTKFYAPNELNPEIVERLMG